MKCQYKLVFNDCQYCPYVTTKSSDHKTLIPWKSCSEVIDDFKNKGFTFNHIAEVRIITIAIKWDITYDFNIKHTICALELKLNAMITENKSLVKKIIRNCSHPLNINFESYCV